MEIDRERAAYAFALLALRGIGKNTAIRVMSQRQTRAELLKSGPPKTSGPTRSVVPEGIVEAVEQGWNAAVDNVNAHVTAGVTPVAWCDPAYPALLRQIPDAPAMVFVKGNLDAMRMRPGVAVIGTREPTPAGPVVAERVTRFLVECGYTIISGLARGIDAVAHRTALACHGTTIAVMAEGLDRVYPREHALLATEISRTGGALLSEHPLGVRARGSSFVERDRIQSGLSIAVVPVQTSLTGGTMHTVRFAERQRRPVMCPRPVQKEMTDVQYEGIVSLVDSGRAWAFDAETYPELKERLDRLANPGDDSFALATLRA
jgi:DNA processing protein